MTGTIRWVGLSCAVSAMMGCSYEMDPDARVNIAPEVRIQTPEDGETVLSEGAVELLGTVFDAQGLHTIDTLTWTSSIDGELGSPELAELDTQGHTRVTTVLSEGLHVLSLTAVDTDQAMGMDTALVTVEAAPDAPVADLVQPVSFESVHMGQDVALFGVVSDEQDDASDLWVSWTVKEHTAGETDLLSEGSPDDSGAVSSSWTPDSPGTYIVGLTVSDTQGNEMHAAAYVFVHDPVGLDLDGDGYTPGQGDCDDADASVSPVAEERCGDGIDNDCSGDLDDRDFDDDGFIDVLCSSYAGTRPTGDCDDEDAATYPGAAEVLDGVDNSCDGRVDDGTESWDMDGDCACPGESCTGSESSACGVVSAGDCDDSDASVYPLADEVCNGMDDNCNGAVDDEDSGVDTSTGQTFYQDGDADGFGDATSPRMACETPAGHVLDDTDCDDSDASVWPGAIELCNGGDDDCDGMTDEADAADALTFYLDADGDSYGRGDWTTMACSAPAGYVADDSDCDDGDDAVYPGASEICNGVDDDCDLRPDDADAGLDTTSATTWSRDADADGYGTKTTQSTSCVAPTGYVEDDSRNSSPNLQLGCPDPENRLPTANCQPPPYKQGLPTARLENPEVQVEYNSVVVGFLRLP